MEVLLGNFLGPLAPWAVLPLRMVVGVTFILHGYPKLLGGTLGGVPENPAAFAMALRRMGVPAPSFFAWVVAAIEFFGGIAILLGLFTRWAAFLLSLVMVVALWRGKLARGVPFASSREVSGWDHPFALLGACVALFLWGPGPFSLDNGLLAWLAD